MSFFTDKIVGYGDLGSYGSTTIRTPRLDRLASEGTRFTNFYAQCVCGPSRSALLTGREPVRSGGWSMPASEVTVAELLQARGYATGCLGKWDVSNRAPIPERMPNGQGFDYFYGSLGGTDSGHIEFYENVTRVAETDDMGGLTRTLTDKAIAFLRAHQARPFVAGPKRARCPRSFFLFLAERTARGAPGKMEVAPARTKGVLRLREGPWLE